jgi:RNA polymerase sigma-70 factor (ECF subfamily)
LYNTTAMLDRTPSLAHGEPQPSPRDPSHAWESAFAAHYVGLCEYVLRFVGTAEAVQDLVQDLFLHLWDTRGPRDVVRLTAPYLYVAARNRALKYLRHRHVAEGWVERAAREEPLTARSPEDRCLEDELEGVVQRAIADLPDRCREIFLLRRRDQRSYQEIAASLQVSLGTVKSQMWRATVRLKQTLAPYLAHALPIVTRGHASYRVL